MRMINPVISIVSGTYNRLASLIRMVESGRRCIPNGVPYEFVLVDGGSTDGTVQWCKSQADIRIIEHGALLGAIRAFCDGAKAAQGDYVILANDDIAFASGSIVRAMVYLESNERCGAVAFMDNRPVSFMPPEQRHMYKAQMQPALLDENTGASPVIYAQVGMFRRWLGDYCGWWGADDPIMSKARTYGGDNWLSSRIWETGYTIDIVDGVQCDDHLVPDSLRDDNQKYNDSAYANAYPRGPILGSKPIDVRPLDSRPRVLYMPIFEPGHPEHKKTKRGLYEALAKRCIVWEWDYLNQGVNGDDLKAFAPHLILSQFHDESWANTIRQMRELMPGALIVNWNGDARDLTKMEYMDMLRGADMQLVVNAAALHIYAQQGIPAAYWQIGYEAWNDALPVVKAHDVVFLGNLYNEARRSLEQALLDTGLDVGFYGAFWQKSSGVNLYDFTTGAALYQAAKIAVGDTFTDGVTDVYGFVSNRLFQALAAGAFMLQQHSEGLQELTGLTAGTHYIEWADTADLKEKIAYWSQPKQAKRRKAIAAAGRAYVLEHFNFDVLVKELFTEILPRLEVERVNA